MTFTSRSGLVTSAIRNTAGPADMSRVLTDHYLALDEDGRAELFVALVMELAARMALEAHRHRVGGEGSSPP